MKPYVYKIIHPSGYFYIGARWANKVPCHEDFGIVYFTSTKHPLVVSDFKAFANTLIECETVDDARLLEKEMIRKSWGDPLLLNKTIPGEKFFCDGHTFATREKMSKSKIGKRPNNFGIPMKPENIARASARAKSQVHSEERRIKAKARMMGNTCGIGNKSRTGQTQSAEERQKKSIALTGRDGWKPTDAQRAHASKMAATRPRVCCLICGNEMQINSFTRHAQSHNRK